MVGCTQSHLSLVENGKRKPSTDFLNALADALDTPLPILFWFAFDRNDVPEHKKDIYDQLKPIVDDLIESIIV